MAKIPRGFSYPCLPEVLPSGCRAETMSKDYAPVEAKTQPKLRKVSSEPELSQSPPSDEGKKFDANLFEEFPFAEKTIKGIFDAARQAEKTIKGIFDPARQEMKFVPNLFEVSPSDGRETKNFDPNLFKESPSDGQETKKIDPVVFEVSPFDGGQETKNFDPNLFDVSPFDHQEEDEFDPAFFEVSPFDGGQAETKNFDPNLLESSPSDGQAEKKFDPVLFEASPFDGGQETKNFNSNLLESSSSDGEEKEEFVPNFFEVLYCDGQENQNSHFRELELSIAKELTDSWFVPVDDRQAKRSNVNISRSERKEKMLDGDNSREEIMPDVNSSEEKALLNEYLNRLELEDATYKEEEVKCDPKLFEVSADDFESLTPLEKRNWIVLQFLLERYDPPCRSNAPAPMLEESDSEDSDQEDCILDLNSLFLEDSGNKM